MNPDKGGWLIFLTIVVAMLLAIVHLPESWPQWLGWLRPAWVPMVLFYWVLAVPHRVGLISAWIIGLFLDVLQGEPLGLNGVLLASITFIGWRFYERLRMYAGLQHSLLVLVLVFGIELARRLINLAMHGEPVGWQFLLVPLVSALVWPFLDLLLGSFRRRVRVE
ncbi:MAG: rod shape-determining protein MreD [Pseudomonadales bacterium]